jgi:ABC-type transport system involved in cytochrome bd biosynthesis fused ATPase/permease subunit
MYVFFNNLNLTIRAYLTLLPLDIIISIIMTMIFIMLNISDVHAMNGPEDINELKETIEQYQSNYLGYVEYINKLEKFGQEKGFSPELVKEINESIIAKQESAEARDANIKKLMEAKKEVLDITKKRSIEDNSETSEKKRST